MKNENQTGSSKPSSPVSESSQDQPSAEGSASAVDNLAVTSTAEDSVANTRSTPGGAQLHLPATITPPTGNAKPPWEIPAQPTNFGRYVVTSALGVGGFGIVYKGYDAQLRREVAIKVPRRERVSSRADVDSYLTEARVLASLDYPGIVPVYDVGRTEDELCYVVSKFVNGSDLATAIQRGRMAVEQSAEIIASVAEALHHAHKRGLVHRDIKPSNILLDETGRSLVADFGLALNDDEFARGSSFCGTPAYMSPEQARGEAHRVDARSDIYSLGVVFYELLTGRRPYRHSGVPEVLDEITSGDVRPPRQIDDKIPKEIERICIKMLAKRAADRYSTALDLAEDLRQWATAKKKKRSHAKPEAAPTVALQPVLAPAPAPTTDAESARKPAKVVPKGLRSFDAQDADFFLQLLPGPRDRDGLPDSIRFWKGRIEETDPDKTFSVGLLYGPSGCGKSSLVKAGLLPRLREDVITVYVESTPADTEARLLKGLLKRCPDLPGGLDLIASLASLRTGRGIQAGQKVVIVLDQFEQWLHTNREEANAMLIQALRHCDGRRVQCLALVRDDFGMAATRFMRELEVPIVEGHNFATVDLFDLQHARKVLIEFGRAFGRLPEGARDVSAEQDQFLDGAVAGLAEDGKVVSVRLALFAEMVKGKPWTQTTLDQVGGASGIGVTFLEETFGVRTGNPARQLHQKAARAVMKALLPKEGSEIRGHMRSRQELLDASGYAHRAAEFDELLRILDGELRLITPTDPQRLAEEVDRSESAPSGKFYQLTHDYLVPAMREWLTRKQRETRRGRAELLLEERSAQWVRSRQSRFLPSLPEYLAIATAMPRSVRRPDQRALMRAAGLHHGVRWGSAMLAVMLGVGFYYWSLLNENVRTHKALAGETKARQTAQQIAEENRQRLVRMNVANGVRLMEEGDLSGSLVWFAEALKLDQAVSERAEMHRARLSAVLRQCPKPVHIWFHDGPVTAAEFSRDGRRALTVSTDTVHLWDVTTGESVTSTIKPGGIVFRASFSPDATRVLTLAGEAQIWDAATGQPITPPITHPGKTDQESSGVNDAAFSHDGKRIATAGNDGTARIWDANTGQSSGIVLKHNQDVRGVSFSPDDGRVVTASWDGTARVWDATTGQPVTPPLSHGPITGYHTDCGTGESSTVKTLRYVGLVGRIFSQCEPRRACPFDNGWQATCGTTAVSVHGDRTGVSSRVFHVIVAADDRSPWLSAIQSFGTKPRNVRQFGKLQEHKANPLDTGFPAGFVNRLGQPLPPIIIR